MNHKAHGELSAAKPQPRILLERLEPGQDLVPDRWVVTVMGFNLAL